MDFQGPCQTKNARVDAQAKLWRLPLMLSFRDHSDRDFPLQRQGVPARFRR